MDKPNLVVVAIVIPLNDWCAAKGLTIANIDIFPAVGSQIIRSFAFKLIVCAGDNLP